MLAARVVLVGLVSIITTLTARGQSFEITPLIGAHAGGSLDLRQEEPSREERPSSEAEAELSGGLSYGVAAGIRFDTFDCQDCALVGFRWMRQETNVRVKRPGAIVQPLAAAIERSRVHLDHYLADFVHEWTLDEAKPVRPFLGLSLGASRFYTPASSKVRLAFGIGAGVKVFPKEWWGFRFYAEYLPTILHADVQRVTCLDACSVALTGGLMNQIVLTVGPVFRF